MAVRTLSSFAVVQDEDGYQVQILDDAGETIELVATASQLEDILELLDELLSDDDTME